MNYYKAETDQDFKFIASLYNPRNTEYMWTSRVSPKQIKERDALPAVNNYILLDNNKKIGWFVINKLLSSNTGRLAIIIDKPYQGKGYGKKTMKFIEGEAKKLGIKKMRLEVMEGNDVAIRLYKKAGYKQTRRLIVMEKKL